MDRKHKGGCVFCRIVAGCEPARVVFQSERLMVFYDHRPAAKVHLLVIPKQHIKNINSLSPDDLELVREMHHLGEKVLQDMDPNGKHKLGYHIPPFTSVDHLHLHAFALPHAPLLKWKYMLPAVWRTAAEQEQLLEEQQAASSCSDEQHRCGQEWGSNASTDTAVVEVECCGKSDTGSEASVHLAQEQMSKLAVAATPAQQQQQQQQGKLMQEPCGARDEGQRQQVHHHSKHNSTEAAVAASIPAQPLEAKPSRRAWLLQRFLHPQVHHPTRAPEQADHRAPDQSTAGTQHVN